jgi:hypothetical protein
LLPPRPKRARKWKKKNRFGSAGVPPAVSWASRPRRSSVLSGGFPAARFFPCSPETLASRDPYRDNTPMLLVPHRTQVIQTNVPAQQIAARLSELVKSGVFRGTIDSEEFRLAYCADLQYSFVTRLAGTIRESPDGNALQIEYSLHPIAGLVLVGFLAPAVADLLAYHQGVGLAFTVAAYLAIFLRFVPAIRASRQAIETMLSY